MIAGTEVIDLAGRTLLPLCPTGRALVWKAPGGRATSLLSFVTAKVTGRDGAGQRL